MGGSKNKKKGKKTGSVKPPEAGASTSDAPDAPAPTISELQSPADGLAKDLPVSRENSVAFSDAATEGSTSRLLSQMVDIADVPAEDARQTEVSQDACPQPAQVEPALTVEEPPELKSSVEEVPEPATPPKPESDPVVVAVTTPPAAPDSTPVPTTTVHSEALHKPSSAKPPLSPGSGSSAAAISEQKEEAIPADPASPAWRETASSTPTPNNSLKEVKEQPAFLFEKSPRNHTSKPQTSSPHSPTESQRNPADAKVESTGKGCNLCSGLFFFF
mmetsp:Transcript_22520/g.42959  ORF Transcript_22520/g.42959 Transcript_22520/m.42959 type:complete len:274 (+) Transcript_22520:130-951(+)|eukprot:CAMPEP_0114226448 /NCGR_PEP_ID=MMETSP0058-20121206/1242_1 /TAXON_ID=36894 /ORGANISM="Pyramimonas parkeae, CCMP726" /LENGTH=273 /DNA_ID=CAMNT_0001337183 /DNA_START=69 /DNA_END=890 /DNA_ORIENTATION=-